MARKRKRQGGGGRGGGGGRKKEDWEEILSRPSFPKGDWRGVALREVLQKVCAHELVKPWQKEGDACLVDWFHPVVERFPDIAESYTAAVSHPMDLALVLRQLVDGVYATSADMLRDICLVFQNAIAFNNISKDTVELSNRIVQHSKHMLQYVKWLALERLVVDPAAAAKKSRNRKTDDGGDGSGSGSGNGKAAEAEEEEEEDNDEDDDDDDDDDDDEDEEEDVGGEGDAAKAADNQRPRVQMGDVDEAEQARIPELTVAERNAARKKRMKVLRKMPLLYTRTCTDLLRKFDTQQYDKDMSNFRAKIEVDKVADYMIRVQRPIWFERIHSRLSHSGAGASAQRYRAISRPAIDEDEQPYKTYGEFLDDVRLVFQNARTYNAAYMNTDEVSRAIYESAIRMQRLLRELEHSFFTLSALDYIARESFKEQQRPVAVPVAEVPRPRVVDPVLKRRREEAKAAAQAAQQERVRQHRKEHRHQELRRMKSLSRIRGDDEEEDTENAPYSPYSSGSPLSPLQESGERSPGSSPEHSPYHLYSPYARRGSQDLGDDTEGAGAFYIMEEELRLRHAIAEGAWASWMARANTRGLYMNPREHPPQPAGKLNLADVHPDSLLITHAAPTILRPSDAVLRPSTHTATSVTTSTSSSSASSSGAATAARAAAAAAAL